MGCDIHMYVERLGFDGKWYCSDYFTPAKNNFENMQHVPLYDGRNYELFAMLANVRNYGNVEPISEPKGIPDDCCDYIKKEDEYWSDDGHSRSWLTLKELIDYKNEHPITKWSGMLNPRQIEELNKGITPNSWCQWTNIEGYEHRVWMTENTVLDYLIEALKDRADEAYLISSWEWGRYDEKGEIGYQKADKIRIVFWFDN